MPPKKGGIFMAVLIWCNVCCSLERFQYAEQVLVSLNQCFAFQQLTQPHSVGV